MARVWVSSLPFLTTPVATGLLGAQAPLLQEVAIKLTLLFSWGVMPIWPHCVLMLQC